MILRRMGNTDNHQLKLPSGSLFEYIICMCNTMAGPDTGGLPKYSYIAYYTKYMAYADFVRSCSSSCSPSSASNSRSQHKIASGQYDGAGCVFNSSRVPLLRI